MLSCPNCSAQLLRVSGDKGMYWDCSACGGRAVGMGPLRRILTKDFVNALWSSAVEHGTPGGSDCPVCEQAMVQSKTSLVVDVCRRCLLVWFDRGEFDAAPVTPVAPRLRLTDEQLEPIARMQAAEIAHEWRLKPGSELSAEDLMMVPAALGLPLEEEATVVNRLPWVTWGLAFVIFLVGAITLWNPGLVQQWGLVPALASRRGGLTFVTSFFIHAGFFHLLTNLYFIVVFGDNVEDFLGRLNYVLLIVAAALAGDGAHALFSQERFTPLVGASSAISGIVVFYGLRFPQAKLRYFRLFRWFSMPAIAATGIWLLSQLFATRDPLSGANEVSVFAHLGGAAVGFWFWFIWRHD
ncbi:MAG TPA: rhomboid family intramembrane serine protease [Actinomycetota bacterium]|nr:rhomboid family intramembrane serine protease [Actinomycetota bacterium]